MFSYIALGDSITAGVGASQPAAAYPIVLASMLRTRGSATMSQVLAEPGWTSTNLVAAVFENGPAYLQTARAISIWVGGDNIAYAGLALLRGAPTSTIASSVKRYTADMTRLVVGIRRFSKARIILCTQYNPFPNTPVAAEGIGLLNTATRTIAGRHGVMVAPADAWFAGRQHQLIDGYKTGRVQDALVSARLPIHPNDAGHRVIARGLYPLVYR